MEGKLIGYFFLGEDRREAIGLWELMVQRNLNCFVCDEENNLLGLNGSSNGKPVLHTPYGMLVGHDPIKYYLLLHGDIK